MGDIALRVRDLGKRYLIGATLDPQRMFVHSALDIVRDPFRRVLSVFRGDATFIDQKEFWALRDLNFEIKHGEVVGLLGRNGAGKSTLLKILSRITAPTTGVAEIYGSIGALLEVGAAFHIELSARDNIYLHGAIYGRSKRETDRIFDEIIDFSELAEFVDTPVKKFSSGMYSRLAFSVAAHFSTDILVVDEVLATGDAKFVKKCLSKMQNVAMTGRTVLFVSHSIDSVRRLCTRGILLEHGRVVADGPAIDIAEQYQATPEETAEPVIPQPETLWSDTDAPSFPNKSVRLRAVRAIGEDGKPRLTYDVAESFFIEMEYEVKRAGPALSAHVYFQDAAGGLLFASLDNLDSPHAAQPQQRGIHRCRCRVPANLLNEGTFSIEYTLCTNPTTDQYATAPGCLLLTVTDARRPGGVRGDWSREWFRCPLRPRLHWEFDPVRTI